MSWKRSIKQHIARFLTLTSLLNIIFLYISSLAKDINFHFSWSECHTCIAGYPVLYFIGSFYSRLLRIDRSILFFEFTPKMFQKYPTVLVKHNIAFTELWNSTLTKGLFYYHCYYCCTINVIYMRYPILSMVECERFIYYVNAICFEHAIHHMNTVIYSTINLFNLFFTLIYFYSLITEKVLVNIAVRYGTWSVLLGSQSKQ